MATGRVPTTANSPLTAKGDLFGYSTTQARVAVGNNGETLVADSSTSTGLRYTAGTVQGNPVINSAMQIAQRGTSVALNAAAGYSLDRWYSYYAGNLTISRQSTNDTTNLPNIQYCARVQRNSGQTNTGGISFGQNFETVNSIPYAGKTVTMSFYARAGANYSSASNALLVLLISGTGTDQNYISGSYTGGANVIYQTATLTTTWQRFSYTATIGATATELAPTFNYTPSGTAGANDYFEVTGVQIDVGNVALPFRTYAGTIQGELAACQRYYQVATRNDSWGTGSCVSTSGANAPLYFFNEMRTAPTIVLPATGSGTNQITYLTSAGGFPATIGTISAGVITKNGFVATGTGYTSAFTAGQSVLLYVSGSTEVWKASAEL
jgi:hypothetical protein